jgi:serine/threonine kinase PknH
MRKGRPVDEFALGRYRLFALIGEGGMGAVYRAHDTMMNRDVAIKVLPTELGDKPDYRERFRREAQIAARLAEPHIIPIHESGEIDGRLYVVMPIIDGVDLGVLLQRDGPMSPQRSVHVIEQLAAALDAAHAVGLVHRDVKPSNALVTSRDFTYLIDFGVAHDAAATKLTRTGMIVGTMAYMAPERFTEGVADARADIYALTCVLYECLTGERPFPGDSIEQQIAGHLSQDPPRPSARGFAIPVGFDEVIGRGMAKKPGHRYQAAHELATAARSALTAARLRPPPESPPPGHPPLPNPVPRQSTFADQIPTPSVSPWQPQPFGNLAAPHQQHPAQQHPAQQHPAGPAIVPQPAAYPPQFGAPAPARPKRRRRAGVIAVTVVILVVSAISGAVLWTRWHASRSASSAPKVPPVTEAALQGILLGPGPINAAMGATGMVVVENLTAGSDDSGRWSDKACLALVSPAETAVYADSRRTAVRAQNVKNSGKTAGVFQAVILFPAARDATSFFAASAQRWPACGNHQFTLSQPDAAPQRWTVGPVDSTNGALSVRETITSGDGRSVYLERALIAVNNVVIDVEAAGNPPSGAAVNIARQIGARVPVA